MSKALPTAPAAVVAVADINNFLRRNPQARTWLCGHCGSWFLTRRACVRGVGGLWVCVVWVCVCVCVGGGGGCAGKLQIAALRGLLDAFGEQNNDAATSPNLRDDVCVCVHSFFVVEQPPRVRLFLVLLFV